MEFAFASECIHPVNLYLLGVQSDLMGQIRVNVWLYLVFNCFSFVIGSWDIFYLYFQLPLAFFHQLVIWDYYLQLSLLPFIKHALPLNSLFQLSSFQVSFSWYFLPVEAETKTVFASEFVFFVVMSYFIDIWVGVDGSFVEF